jgi:hypothetical protein
MQYSFYDFLMLIGSLGLFLYGMKIMSEGLQKVAGDRLRSILTAMTTNRVTGGMMVNSSPPIRVAMSLPRTVRRTTAAA